MTDNLLLTYSLLGYLKETNKHPTGSLTEIFVPIAKKALSDYSKEKNLTEIKGASLNEIQSKIKEVFDLEIPIPILRVILKSIEKDINDEQIFSLFDDNSFIIKSYVFEDIEEQITKERNNIKLLENNYEEFCKQTNTQFNFSDLKEFILAQKIDLFSSKKSSYLDLNYSIPKYISLKFEDDKIFNIITNIYLGGIISSYLTLTITKKITDAELLIDTNFFISLIDLNTEDSFHTCKQLFDLCKRMGFRITILNTTVEQIKILLNNRIFDFKSRDFIGSVKSADVFNACIRRNIDKTQLERIRDNVLTEIYELGIVIIQDAQIKEVIEKAKKSKTYKDLLGKRDFELSALNDAIADEYVKAKRGTNIQEFADVKCWFLHNSFHSHFFAQAKKVSDRYALGANELLVLLWLSNPSQINAIQDKVIVQGALSSYVTKYRRNKMPSKEILKVIKNRADKALEQGQITERDIFNTCLRMTEGQITNDDVTNIENISDEDFAVKFKEFSESTNKHIENLVNKNSEKDLSINELNEKNQKQEFVLEQQKQTIEQQQSTINQLENRLGKIEEKEYEREKEKYVRSKIRKDKKNVFSYITFIVFVSILWFLNHFYADTLPTIVASIIAFVLFIAGFIIVRFINHSYIQSVFCKKKTKRKYQKEFEDNNFKIA